MVSQAQPGMTPEYKAQNNIWALTGVFLTPPLKINTWWSFLKKEGWKGLRLLIANISED